jgi:hypothetical protein
VAFDLEPRPTCLWLWLAIVAVTNGISYLAKNLENKANLENSQLFHPKSEKYQ